MFSLIVGGGVLIGLFYWMLNRDRDQSPRIPPTSHTYDQGRSER